MLKRKRGHVNHCSPVAVPKEQKTPSSSEYERGTHAALSMSDYF